MYYIQSSSWHIVQKLYWANVSASYIIYKLTSSGRTKPDKMSFMSMNFSFLFEAYFSTVGNTSGEQTVRWGDRSIESYWAARSEGDGDDVRWVATHHLSRADDHDTTAAAALPAFCVHLSSVGRLGPQCRSIEIRISLR